ncbi:hypothetical protein BGX38DRAFT_1235744, partial [Terfezia claveryi]
THWNVAPSTGMQHQCWAVDLASGTHWDVGPVPGTQAYMQPFLHLLRSYTSQLYSRVCNL